MGSLDKFSQKQPETKAFDNLDENIEQEQKKRQAAAEQNKEPETNVAEETAVEGGSENANKKAADSQDQDLKENSVLEKKPQKEDGDEFSDFGEFVDVPRDAILEKSGELELKEEVIQGEERIAEFERALENLRKEGKEDSEDFRVAQTNRVHAEFQLKVLAEGLTGKSKKEFLARQKAREEAANPPVVETAAEPEPKEAPELENKNEKETTADSTALENEKNDDPESLIEESDEKKNDQEADDQGKQNEKLDDTVEADVIIEPDKAVQEQPPASSEDKQVATIETEKPTEQQLLAKMEQSHVAYVDAQRIFQRAKNQINILNRAKTRLSKTGLGKKVLGDLGQLEKEFNDAEEKMKEAKKLFREDHKKYSSAVVEKKKQAMVEKKRVALEKDFKDQPDSKWTDEEIEKFFSGDFQKTKEFQDEIKTFVLEEKVVGSDAENVAEKMSLFEDMNKRIMEVGRARREALSEKGKSIFKKAWEGYNKLPPKTKKAVGFAAAISIPVAAGVAGGASAGTLLGLGAFTGGRKIVSGIAGGLFGKKAYSWMKKRSEKKAPAKKEKSEQEMAKGFSEGKDVDLFKMLNDQLNQKKKDNQKAIAASVAAGFAAGGGVRGLLDFDISSLIIPDSPEVIAKMDAAIHHNFDQRVSALEGDNKFEKSFEAWKEFKQELIDKGHRNTKAFENLEKTYGSEGYEKFLETQKAGVETAPSEISGDSPETNTELPKNLSKMAQEINEDWDGILSGEEKMVADFPELVAANSFKEFVEQKYGNFDPHKKVTVEQWKEYKAIVPADAQDDKAFRFFDRQFNQYDEAPSSRIKRREFNDITKIFRDSENEYEIRTHGAELAKKMGIEFDPFAKSIQGGYEGTVLTEINGHKVPLELLSEEDRVKVLSARKMSEMMEGQMNEADEISSESEQKAPPEERQEKQQDVNVGQEGAKETEIPEAEQQPQQEESAPQDPWQAAKEDAKEFKGLGAILVNVKKGDIELSANEILKVQNSKAIAQETIDLFDATRAEGTMPSVSEERIYKKALKAMRNAEIIEEKAGLNVEQSTEAPVETAPSEGTEETPELTPEEIKELAGNEEKDRISQEDWQKMREAEELAGNEEADRMSPEEWKKMNAELENKNDSQVEAGAEEVEKIPDAEKAEEQAREESEDIAAQAIEKEPEDVGGSGEVKSEAFSDKVEPDAEAAIPDFEQKLSSGDTVWDILEDKMDGDQNKVGNTILQFKKATAADLMKTFSFNLKDSQNYLDWRFRNLQPNDLVSLENGKLDIENFVDADHIDKFVDKFEIVIDEEAAVQQPTPSDPPDQTIPVVEKSEAEIDPDEAVASAEEIAEFSEGITEIDVQRLENIEAASLIEKANQERETLSTGGGNDDLQSRSAGRGVLFRIQNEMGEPRKNESALSYFARYEEQLTKSEKKALASLMKKG